ncbi:adenylosuccinate synthase [Candidatus Gottesmanbacteria bacterium]|nr:adenylosuccinate synthase [Candidatus Gottesmanbacteria bacterium]
MKPTVIIGSQWGDEGKGKLVDAMARGFDVVCRFNGGNNAGHTIVYGGEPCKLHVLPSGLFQRKKLVIAQGAVFDPEILLVELEFCKKHHIGLDLLIDYRVNLVMPYHKLFDAAHEAWKGKKATGSVKVGIGYCYEDRNNRSGIRTEDLLYPNILREKLTTLVPIKQKILTNVYGEAVKLDAQIIYKRLLFFGKLLTPYLGDVSAYISKNLGKKSMLFEGAMGTMLDGQFGTYPYTVANNTIASSLFTSLGTPAFPTRVIGVVKAYTTRVGGGPFPTEQNNDNGKRLQAIGGEIAATSGRIRRCGWLDIPIVRYAHRLNRFDALALTKLDVLSTFSRIPVCTNYRMRKTLLSEQPAISHDYQLCRPVYKTLPGWKKSLAGVKKVSELPKEARRYIEYVEDEIGVPIRYISLGPERDQLLRV